MEFWEELKERYESGAAAAFILKGNTRDYVSPGVSLASYIAEKLSSRLVVFYGPTGFRFPFPSHEKEARRLVAEASDSNGDGIETQMMLQAAQSVLRLPIERRFEWPSDPASAIPMIDKLLRAEKDVAVVIEYAGIIFPENATPADRRVLAYALEWGRKGDPRELRNLIILVEDEGGTLNTALNSVDSGYAVLELGKPDEERRLSFLRYALSVYEVEPDLPVEELARRTAGLSLLQIEDMLLMRRGRRLSRDDAKAIKDEMIRQEYGGLVEIIEPEARGFEAMGGKELLKRWLREEIIRPLEEGRLSDVPKGLVFAGPPGTGKTYAVACLAGEIGFNAIALDAGRIQSRYVGDTQARLGKVFDLARTLYPVIIFIDELDQSDLARRGNDSGNPVAADMFSMILRFLGDESNRGKVVVIGATNRPDLLDPALRRSGRLEYTIPFLTPDAEERRAIAQVQVRLQRGAGITDDALTLVQASDFDLWSGADIAALIRRARKAAGGGVIDAGAIKAALATMKPDTSAVAYYTSLAVRYCTEIGLLPEGYERLMADNVAAEPPAFSAERRQRRL